jgi:hypothetical protein
MKYSIYSDEVSNAYFCGFFPTVYIDSVFQSSWFQITLISNPLFINPRKYVVYRLTQPFPVCIDTAEFDKFTIFLSLEFEKLANAHSYKNIFFGISNYFFV